MKFLPMEYWENDYKGVSKPSYIQRYWVQRCLELLDSDTAYIHTLKPVNSFFIIQELIKADKIRDIYFLICELEQQLKNDRALDIFAEIIGLHPLSDFYDLIKACKDEGDKHFMVDGTETTSSSRKDFHQALEQKTLGGQSWVDILSTIFVGLENDHQSWLKAHEVALEKLLSNWSEYDARIIAEVETVTQSWLLELITHKKYASLYLSELFTSIFLTSSLEDFNARLTDFFNKLSGELSSYQVFMRLQAPKKLGQVGQINNVIFSPLNNININILKEVIDNLKGKQFEEASNFFNDIKNMERFVYVIIYGIKAENINHATHLALAELEQALHQVRLEFERNKLSLDNTIYVYNHPKTALEKYTYKQVLANNYLGVGSSAQLKTLVNQIEHISQHNHKSIKQLTGLALQWHRNGLENHSSEIRFMSHWVELEQIAKSHSQPGIGAGDMVVRAVSRLLNSQIEWEFVRSIWGDLQRCLVLGTKPYMVKHSGQIKYTGHYHNRLRNNNYNNAFYRLDKNQPIDITISDKKGAILKNYRIPNGFIVFKKNNELIEEGEWLAGPDLSNLSLNYSPLLRDIFVTMRPDLNNVLYLVKHWEREIEQIIGNGLITNGVRKLSAHDINVYSQIEDFCRYLEFYLNSDSKRGLKFTVSGLKNQSKEIKYGLDTEMLRQLSVVIEWSNQIYEQLPDIDKLQKIAEMLMSNESLRNVFWFELFRGCTPDFERLEILLDKKGNPLLENLFIKPVEEYQPLLHSRLVQKQMITRSEFVWELDRARRVRNQLVHEGEITPNMALIARRLYHFSKTYVRSAIYRIARKPDDPERGLGFY